jgi:hypothetical protein
MIKLIRIDKSNGPAVVVKHMKFSGRSGNIGTLLAVQKRQNSNDEGHRIKKKSLFPFSSSLLPNT